MAYWRRVVSAVMLSLLVVASAGYAVTAQQGEGSGLSISPTRTELAIAPGTTDVVKLTLRNVSGQDVTAKAIVNNFQADGVTGEPKIIIDEKEAPPTSIKPFLGDVKDINLKKDEKVDFEVPVEVPANAAPGAYYGVIRYTAVPLGEELPQDNKVALTASVGSLVLIEVQGDINEQIQIQSMKVLQNNKSGSFFLKSPDKVAIDIKNNGNGFSKPFGRVNIHNGGKEVYSYELNNSDPKGNILPASSRVFTDDIKNVKMPGRYSVTANISHGRGGDVITYKSSFWYVPAWVMIAALGLLAAIVAISYLVYRKRFSNKGRKARR